MYHVASLPVSGASPKEAQRPSAFRMNGDRSEHGMPRSSLSAREAEPRSDLLAQRQANEAHICQEFQCTPAWWLMHGF